MPIPHLLLTLLIISIWGVNFVFVKFALLEMQPFLLCAVRFLLASIPAIFFIKPPAIPFRMVAVYGLITFALQFSLLFIGMHVGMTPGMASLILQVQIFFSMFFAAFLFNEHPSRSQIAGAIISFAGIVLVAMHFDQNMSLMGFIFILGAAAAWGTGNLIAKQFKKINMIALVIWGSFIASLPMLIASLMFEGTNSILESYHNVTWLGALSVLYIVYASTWIAYGAWNWLLSRYPVNLIVPFTLLIPIVGILSSVMLLDEPLQDWKMQAAFLVIGGLCVNLLGSQFAIKNKIKNEN